MNVGKTFLVRAGVRQAMGAAAAMAAALVLAAPAWAVDDAYRPPADPGYATNDTYQPAPPQATVPPVQETYEPYRPLDNSRRAGPNPYPAPAQSDPSGYGEPYVDEPATANNRQEHYEPVPPADQGGPPEAGSNKYYSQDEIVRAGHSFFGKVSGGLASAVEWAFQKAGRPNGYILGQDAGGALVAGLRYGEGTLHTKDAGTHKVYWQGPSLGYDFGAEGSKVMTLVYNLSDPSELYDRFGGVEGSAYLVGGVSVQLQKKNHVTLAPIRAGLGLRLGANVGYLKYSRRPTWNPF